MPPTDRLLRDLWRAIEHAGDVERELRATADQLAGWREVAQAAIAALHREIGRSREADAARTIA